MVIGWLMDRYSIGEDAGSLVVCAGVMAGQVSGNVSVAIYYIPGNATGNWPVAKES